MNFLAQAQGLFGGADPVPAQDPADAASLWADRLRTSTLPDDRRRAVSQLRDLAGVVPSVVAKEALSLLLQCCADGGDGDLRVVQDALDGLERVVLADRDALLVVAESPRHVATLVSGAAGWGRRVAVLTLAFCDAGCVVLGGFWLAFLFGRNSVSPAPVLGTVSLLGSGDNRTRFFVLRLLDAALGAARRSMVAGVMADPRGVGRLMDAVRGHGGEILRNEALALLRKLCGGGQMGEMAKILAFEGAFDVLLALAWDEECAGPIADDALTVVAQLLRASRSNRSFCLETACVPRLAALLESVVAGAEVRGGGAVVAALRVAAVLLARGTAADDAAWATLRAAGLPVPHVLAVATAAGCPDDVRSVALQVLGDMMLGQRETQDQMTGAFCPAWTRAARPEPALLRLLALALRKGGAAVHAFQAFLAENSDGQLIVASTLTPVPRMDEGEPREGEAEEEEEEDLASSVGNLIVDSLRGWSRDPASVLRSWWASWIFCKILANNERCQGMALRIPTREEGVSLMHVVLDTLAAAARADAHHLVILGLLRILCAWLSHCPAAVAVLLGAGGAETQQAGALSPTLQQLLELAMAPAHGEQVQGLAATALGLCLLYAPAGSSAVEQLEHIMLQGTFVERLEQVRASAAFQAALETSATDSSALLETNGDVTNTMLDHEVPLYDHAFTSFFATFLRDFSVRLGVELRQPAGVEVSAAQLAELEDLRKQLAGRDAKIAELQAAAAADTGAAEPAVNAAQESELALQRASLAGLTAQVHALTQTCSEYERLYGAKEEDVKRLEGELAASGGADGAQYKQLQAEFDALQTAHTSLREEFEELLVILAEQSEDAPSATLHEPTQPLYQPGAV